MQKTIICRESVHKYYNLDQIWILKTFLISFWTAISQISQLIVKSNAHLVAHQTFGKKSCNANPSRGVRSNSAQKMQEMTGMRGIWPEWAESIKKNARNERNLSGTKNARNERNLSGKKCKKWEEFDRNKKCRKWAEFDMTKRAETLKFQKQGKYVHKVCKKSSGKFTWTKFR